MKSYSPNQSIGEPRGRNEKSDISHWYFVWNKMAKLLEYKYWNLKNLKKPEKVL